jgi:hypothetical protein
MQEYHCYVQRFAILANSLKTTKPKYYTKLLSNGIEQGGRGQGGRKAGESLLYPMG